VTLFPSFVACASTPFSVDADPELAFPGIAVPDSLARAVPKRQVEFVAGRWCARAALRRLGAADAPIGIGAQREPLWPPGIVGSITHTLVERNGDAGIAAAAVAHRHDASGIGYDIERIMDDELADRVLETIATREEIARLVRATGWPMPLVLTLVFSAKETLFKCLYADVRAYFDFHDAKLVTIDDAMYQIELVRSLTPGLPAGAAFAGRLDRTAEIVATGMVR